MELARPALAAPAVCHSQAFTAVSASAVAAARAQHWQAGTLGLMKEMGRGVVSRIRKECCSSPWLNNAGMLQIMEG